MNRKRESFVSKLSSLACNVGDLGFVCFCMQSFLLLQLDLDFASFGIFIIHFEETKLRLEHIYSTCFLIMSWILKVWICGCVCTKKPRKFNTWALVSWILKYLSNFYNDSAWDMWPLKYYNMHMCIHIKESNHFFFFFKRSIILLS